MRCRAMRRLYGLSSFTSALIFAIFSRFTAREYLDAVATPLESATDTGASFLRSSAAAWTLSLMDFTDSLSLETCSCSFVDCNACT